jgi:hypothetical protein
MLVVELGFAKWNRYRACRVISDSMLSRASLSRPFSFYEYATEVRKIALRELDPDLTVLVNTTSHWAT